MKKNLSGFHEIKQKPIDYLFLFLYCIFLIVVSTSSCPVFLTNEMSGWLKLYRVIAETEIDRSSCFFS